MNKWISTCNNELVNISHIIGVTEEDGYVNVVTTTGIKFKVMYSDKDESLLNHVAKAILSLARYPYTDRVCIYCFKKNSIDYIG